MQTTATLAADLDTTPRTLRKFLRAQDMGVGKGARYSLPTSKREVASLKKRFIAWQEATEAKKAPAEEVTPEVEVDDFDALEGPTAEEIAEYN